MGSQLNGCPEGPQHGITLVLFCIVCFVAASLEHNSSFRSRPSVLSAVVRLTSVRKGLSSNNGAFWHPTLPLLFLGASSQSGPLNVRSPGSCLHFVEDELWGLKTTTVRKPPCVGLLPCLKGLGVCLLEVLENRLCQVEDTVEKMEESLGVQRFIC